MSDLCGKIGRIGLALFVLGALAACDTGGTGGIRKIDILDGAVTAAAPAGYCIAPQAGLRGADTAVVLIGPCSATTQTEPAVLTLTFGPAGSGSAMQADPSGMADLLQSENGRKALSRSGQADDATVLQILQIDTALLVLIRDRALGDYWRAMLPLRGRMVAVSTVSAEGMPIAPEKGRALVGDAITALTAANRDGQIQDNQ